jgi:hypothetical protein
MWGGKKGHGDISQEIGMKRLGEGKSLAEKNGQQTENLLPTQLLYAFLCILWEGTLFF